ncbi:DUF3558 domain-containing protein [Rhodococcus sp. PAMC28707]|uniref:DUF3558 domain-containing protein n=1 Tax=unclassified Rhodococcus (in: high G+C Gram-positive bacteria) TaxID=192944 RepID=UPI00109E3315|nr:MULTISPECIES: DUF3558 domain-containing protein [unclassified Rhodococcus (in: high G+C Gram-positive bacteria)]QCB52022.1 DUF3558 domain-containing protein [Rhodococcus sp. PAMC28705]QCB59810.1 DUF3558 domain-containing protein [Rhodococcus sp. PAMC28707]
MQRRWLPLFAVAAVLTSCSQPVEGVAVAGVPGQADQFDPCAIPDDAIAATGLKPETGSGWLEGMSVKAWTNCGWEGPQEDSWYRFDVLFSIRFTLDEVRQNVAFRDFKEVSVSGRPALEYLFEGRPSEEGCGTSFDTAEGVAMISVDALGTAPPQGDPCELVRRHTIDLQQYFPSSI